MEYYALIFNDTVYGIGESPEGARLDASNWATGTDRPEMRTEQITLEQYQRIQRDQITECSELGII